MSSQASLVVIPKNSGDSGDISGEGADIAGDGGDIADIAGDAGDAGDVGDAGDDDAQRNNWQTLKRDISALMSHLNHANIQHTIVQLFKLNIERGRGLVVRVIMKLQMKQPKEAALLASLAAVLNSKFPKLGRLLCSRLLLQFRSAYITNNWLLCKSSLLFICHLTMQRVLSEILILQVIQLLLNQPTKGDIELTVDILSVCGSFLSKNSKAATNMILARLADILQEFSSLSNRSKSSIRYALRLGQSGFKSAELQIDPKLALVEEEDIETHDLDFGAKVRSRDYLNVYRFDPDFAKSEMEYDRVRREIIVEEEESQEEGEKEEAQVGQKKQPAPAEVNVSNMTQSSLIEFQKRVYLTVMSSMSADEAVHKLLKLSHRSKKDQEQDNKTLADMIIKCCSQDKTYTKFFGIIGEKLCSRNRYWHDNFVDLFKDYYNIIDNFETNSLRNVGKFFGHLFASDVIALDQAWSDIKITERDTTPARRILLKFVFQEMVEEMGIGEVKKRLIYDEFIKDHINGVFFVKGVTWEDADDIRFSINFFTAIGLGVLTEEMREVLANLPEPESRGRKRHRRNSDDSSRGSSDSSRSYSRSTAGSRSRSFSRSRSTSQNLSRLVGDLR
ncbi:CWC22 [Candida oxycetoniae]|uniref:Pre-mRNA-splicing factor CWC22 n=1 Tax=Candida oxycetoniae TaxID=497107 RepID=A0AAI9SWX4_9ASCO|nr:CWC22 [Candida oxycetoniae]KAI3404473.2 CWC22 [Candida oxycetoniae]